MTYYLTIIIQKDQKPENTMCGIMGLQGKLNLLVGFSVSSPFYDVKRLYQHEK